MINRCACYVCNAFMRQSHVFVLLIAHDLSLQLVYGFLFARQGLLMFRFFRPQQFLLHLVLTLHAFVADDEPYNAAANGKT